MANDAHHPLAPERVPQSVRDAVKRLGITFPVVIDNDNRIWNAYHNQYWPAAYFADATGKLRFYNFGEGRYDEQDKVVAKLLAERDAAAKSTTSTSMSDRDSATRDPRVVGSARAATLRPTRPR